MSSECVNFGEHSLFVANLPQRLTNEQLAYSLIYIFHRFGQILSVKASRDFHGRPFGFVEFKTDSEVSRALLNCENLSLEGRKIRIELAKCQRKICVKTAIESNRSINDIVDGMRNDFLVFSKPENIKINITSMHIIAIIKFNDVHRAEEAFKIWNAKWNVKWVQNDKSLNGSTVRCSGLVQVIPKTVLDNQFLPLYFPTKLYIVPFYEEIFNDNLVLEELLKEDDILNFTVFVGRINSQLITRELFLARFSKYGMIRYARIYNRGMVGCDGIPIDSHAFIIYKDRESTELIIKSENGNVWLGQLVKCERARTLSSNGISKQTLDNSYYF